MAMKNCSNAYIPIPIMPYYSSKLMLTCDYMKIRRAAGNRTEVLQLILQATLDILEEDSFPDDGDSEQEDLTESTYAKNKKNES